MLNSTCIGRVGGASLSSTASSTTCHKKILTCLHRPTASSYHRRHHHSVVVTPCRCRRRRLLLIASGIVKRTHTISLYCVVQLFLFKSASIFIAKQHRGSRCYIKLAQVILVDNTIHSVTNRRLVSVVERVAVHQLSVDEGIQSNQSRLVLTANRTLHMFILDDNSNNISAVSSRLWQSAVVS